MRWFRYADLQARGLVRSRAALRNLIKNYEFPEGRLIGRHQRAWSDEEVEAWEASRPTAPRKTPRGPGRRKARLAVE